MGVSLTGTLQVCYHGARSKAKSSVVIKKTHTRVSNPVESISVDATCPLTESLIGKRYWIGIKEKLLKSAIDTV